MCGALGVGVDGAMMNGPEGNYAWWMKMLSGKHHLTALRNHKEIYPACAPDVWWSNSSRRGWDVIMKNPSRIPENACEMCQRYVVLWGML